MNDLRHIAGLAEVVGGELTRRPVHLAIGMFDGVHLGHRAVIEAALISARRTGGLVAALTFAPHPSRLFRPEDPVRLIQSPDRRARGLREAGADYVIDEPFTAAFAAIEAEEFVPYLRRHLPRLTAIYVGENWRFGRGRRGDVKLLNAEARRAGLSVISAPRINHNGEPISSTRIRAHLLAGEIEAANALLGYSYTSEGVVTPGRRLGRTMGFPTLNLPWEPELRPRHGVYGVGVRAAGAAARDSRPAVANYGLRPTVEAGVVAPRLEVHVCDARPVEWGAGATLVVEWLVFFRPEQRFESMAALGAQIELDRAAAQAWWAER